ncbi:transcription factor IIIB 60 kDa subunit-like isoform X1 [Cicer arietinum]|uniref:Transcription factor IIIB 90 kDa subunit-like isoform X1 n=1 Tax=Cicer arietinum TaxID=3827 RepID=A0A1S2XT65_CICAR|nr:transcription factor IIIB 90 kDa subunit-like isoform X1 [Cicer arietinum]
MVFCDHCVKNVTTERVDECYLVCSSCGKVLEDHFFAEETTFVKNSAGQSKVSGNFVSSIRNDITESRQRTLDRARDEMRYLSFGLGVHEEDMTNKAVALYRIALERNFTRGRKSEQVQAACLYIAFRDNNKPYLLIDFSNYLRINVYVLGAVFLQLCQVLRLQEHPIVRKPIDPSLFLYKYTNSLLKHRNVAVSETALNIIASMNRDWMQTGRKPSGLFGAALYISVLAHGFNFSKPDILRIVHVCEATLTKRLVEFENTDSSSLTIEELNTMAKEHEKNMPVLSNSEFKGSTSKDLLCEHKADSNVPHFALGLCETCYKDFDKLSGGLGGGLDPPAFQRAERERAKKILSKESADVVKPSNSACKEQKEDLATSVLKRHNFGSETTKHDEYDDSHREDDTSAEAQDESGNLSDIDDEEVDPYLNNEEETKFKRIIWENENQDYIKEQAAKEAYAEAEKKAFEENMKNCPEDVLAARERYQSATAAVAKSRKEMKQRRAQQTKNSGPAQSAAEAACQMMKAKRLSKKINFDCLAKLFEDEPANAGNPKKVRFDLPSDNHDKFQSKVEDQKDDELRSADNFEDGDQDNFEDGDQDWDNNENMDGAYFPEEDDHSYDVDYY